MRRQRRLSHIDDDGRAKMVDVSEKDDTMREAVARGTVSMKSETVALIRENRITKGDVLTVAQVAGISAAKKTGELIPLCHPLHLTNVSIDFKVDEDTCSIEIQCTVNSSGKTGVEMEALTGVSVAALALYDMCKAVDREMTISDIRLVEKRGGKSGVFRREEGR